MIPLALLLCTNLSLCRRSVSYLYSEHGFRAESLELLLCVGVVVPLVALESGLLFGQRAGLFVEAGIDYVRALLHCFKTS